MSLYGTPDDSFQTDRQYFIGVGEPDPDHRQMAGSVRVRSE